MREEFKGELWRDFQQRYGGTFGWYEKPSGDKVLVVLSEVSEKMCKFLDEDDQVFTAFADKNNHFQFLPVKRGLYQTEHGIVYCRRIPAKQYKRGVSDSNTHLEKLPTGKPIGVSFSIVRELFDPKPNNYLAEFKKNIRPDIVFDNFLGIIDGGVYLYNNYIGDRMGSALLLKNTLFKQEVQDIVTANQLDMHVEVR